MSKIVRYTRDNLPAIGERVHSFQIYGISGLYVYLKDIEWVRNGYFGTIVAILKDKDPDLDAKVASGEYLIYAITGNRVYPVVRKKD